MTARHALIARRISALRAIKANPLPDDDHSSDGGFRYPVRHDAPARRLPHEHRASYIRSDGVAEWEYCSCGLRRVAPGGPWVLPPRPYGGDCPDCSALDGQPCDAGCLRYREDPE